MTIFLTAMITSVVLLVPALYFFIVEKYKLMTLTLVIDLIITITLVYLSHIFRN